MGRDALLQHHAELLNSMIHEDHGSIRARAEFILSFCTRRGADGALRVLAECVLAEIDDEVDRSRLAAVHRAWLSAWRPPSSDE